jgi:catechol 2,3-dioxygenase
VDHTDTQVVSFLSQGALDHDLAFTIAGTGQGGLNHVAYAVATHEDVMRAADLLRDEAHECLEFRPGRHAVAGGFYLYAQEPGGNRIEVFTPETLIFAPDWQPVRWLVSQNLLMYWGRGEVPGAAFDAGTAVGRQPRRDIRGQ